MSERVRELARRFELANSELIMEIEPYSDREWRTIAEDDERSVGTVAHHVASWYGDQADLIRGIASREAVPALTWEKVHEVNGEHAQEHPAPSKEETLALLREQGQVISAVIRGLREDQLECTAELPLLGTQPVTTKEYVEKTLIDHIQLHLNSIRAATNGSIDSS